MELTAICQGFARSSDTLLSVPDSGEIDHKTAMCVCNSVTCSGVNCSGLPEVHQQ